MSTFDRDLKKLIEFNVYGSFLVSLGTYLFTTLDTAANLDAETATGKAFAYTNAVVLSTGMVIILARTAMRSIKHSSSNQPKL